SLGKADFQEGMQKSEGRFGPLVLIAAVGVQAISAASGGGIVDRQAEIIAAQEPVESPMEMGIPEAGAGHMLGRQAGGDHGLGFNRLLVEARPGAAAREKSIAAD